MPYYDYICDKCGEFEVFQSITDPILVDCPKCNELGIKTSIKKLISKSSFILHGNCWAKDSYSK